VTRARMSKVSREPSTTRGSGELGRESILLGASPRVDDLLFCNCLGDAGVHGSSLSMESWLATAIRMN